MKDFTPGLNSAIDIIEKGVIFERLYVSVYYLLQGYGYELERKELPEVFEIQVN